MKPRTQEELDAQIKLVEPLIHTPILSAPWGTNIKLPYECLGAGIGTAHEDYVAALGYDPRQADPKDNDK